MLIFLKLGGSLITDKSVPYSAKKDVIKRLGLEILEFLGSNPSKQLLIGHGSGSFGHAAASEYDTINGVETERDWIGFQNVWWAAHQLNQIVCELFIEIGLPIISLPTSSSLVSDQKTILQWNIQPILKSLQNKLIPMIFGDVIYDKSLGGTIFSTEELFSGLLEPLKPATILLAGKESGVYRDYPSNMDLVEKITPGFYKNQHINLEQSGEKDVTGGMAAKVLESISLVERQVGLEVQIFSGEKPGNLLKALQGKPVGTLISAN